MALFDKTTRFFLLGAGAGVGALLAAPLLGPIVTAVVRPFAKACIKQSYLGFLRGREALGRAIENLEDVVAEVQSEIEEERVARAGAASGAGSTPVADRPYGGSPSTEDTSN